MVLSEQVDAGMLKNKCLEFVKQNIKAVRQTEGWEGVEKNNTLLIEIVALIAGDTPTQLLWARSARPTRRGSERPSHFGVGVAR